MVSIVRYLFLFVVLILGLSFFTLNNQAISLNYYFGNMSVSFSIVMIIAIALGALLGLMGSLRPIMKLRRQVAELKRSNVRAQQSASQVQPIAKEGR